ncbi:hypothetical protein [Xenorhabdus bovienii]|uniref:hypothetical protein n=1 Tax=Xenorhabdus bovienii TaxID=40576 RepID=UPI0023B2DD02|nr:hypothetical protein [Xenorhabdus bovienii]MDE9551960.1 hypothetical protein [Xenorhabdus bovienii]
MDNTNELIQKISELLVDNPVRLEDKLAVMMMFCFVLFCFVLFCFVLFSTYVIIKDRWSKYACFGWSNSNIEIRIKRIKTLNYLSWMKVLK